MPPAVRNDTQIGVHRRADIIQSHISISAAGRKLFLREACSKLAENKCCFEIKHHSLCLSLPNNLSGVIFQGNVYGHTQATA